MVGDLAYPLPVIVIADLLGVPAVELSLTGMSEEQQEFRSQLDVSGETTDHLRVHAAERRTRPRPDLLTELVRADVDGERLSDNETVDFEGLQLLAGHITTTLLLGNTVLCLDAHPEQARRVRADRATVPTSIEESLRLLTPFAAPARVTRTDVEVRGRRVPGTRC